MHAKSLVSLLAACSMCACARVSTQPLQQFSQLKFSDKIVSADFKQQERKVFEASNQHSFGSPRQWYLKIMVENEISPTSALEKISFRRETLKQNLMRQRDPYNIEPGSLACDLAQFDRTDIDDSFVEFSLQLSLKATKYYLTECYNSEAMALDELVEFLYCKKKRILFEIHLFRPKAELQQTPFRLANCL